MSTLTLDDVKKALAVTHSEDDSLIQRLLDSSARECAKHVYGQVPDYSLSGAVSDPLTVPEYANGIVLMVRADYEADPIDRDKYLEAAKGCWHSGAGWTL